MTSGEKMLDPVCDMIVDLAEARDQGLVMELGEREYAFCAHGCLVTFAKNPSRYVPKVDAWLASRSAPEASHAHDEAPLTIDEGVRAWYKSCRCCLSEAHPQVVERLDAEKAAQAPGTSLTS